MSKYEHSTTMQVRYRDLDTMNHVNNAAYVTYLEQARIDYLQEVVGGDVEDYEMVVASLEIEYRRAIRYQTDVTVNVTVDELGDSSFHMTYEILADGETAATAETVQVVVNEEAGNAQPIPSAWREKLMADEGC